MATLVYLLCALTSAACALLLIREFRRSRSRVLLWASLAFVGFALNNALVFTDFVLVPEQDLALVRALTALLSAGLLVFALEGDRA